jgi:mitogen-activated protein kinase kinase kinase
MDRRYKGILDSVRVRQRKLFRFSRQLTNTFENTTEFSINMAPHLLQELYDNLTISGHVLVNATSQANDNILVLASPNLADQQIVSIASTCYRADNAPTDASNPYVLLLFPEQQMFWGGDKIDLDMKLPKTDLKPGKLRLVAQGGTISSSANKNHLDATKFAFLQATGFELEVLMPQRANVPSVDHQLRRIKRSAFALSSSIMNSVELIRSQLAGLDCQELIQNCFAFATEFGQRSVMYMDYNRRALNNAKLTRLALEWVSFICDDCIAADRKTFRWAVTALEFAMIMTRGQNILAISDEEYAILRNKVAGCMSLLISHFDIMGARSTVAAQTKSRNMLDASGTFRMDLSKIADEDESAKNVRDRWYNELTEIETLRKTREAERQALGRVLEDNNEADRSLTFLSAAATNATLRWQQGQFLGGGEEG